ncbi:MAG: plasmid pRiA4b ORF-3 family protein [Acidobacteriota bacterium]|nr:plasmid pRiA4b ORF-3 family protein [Acidobacteriota bacterium]
MSSGTRDRPGNGRSPLGPGQRSPATHPEGSDAVRLSITLKDIEPAPRRVVDVPLSLTLAALHNVIQVAFGWWDYHLWEFQIGTWRIAVPDPEDEAYPDARPFADARRFPLSRCVTWGVERMVYLYDFGDYWQHEVRLEGMFTADDPYALPAFVEGAWAAPREDSGGVGGFAEFKEAVADPFHEEREELLAWYGGPFDPANIHREKILEGMAAIRAYRMSRRRKARRPGSG